MLYRNNLQEIQTWVTPWKSFQINLICRSRCSIPGRITTRFAGLSLPKSLLNWTDFEKPGSEVKRNPSSVGRDDVGSMPRLLFGLGWLLVLRVTCSAEHPDYFPPTLVVFLASAPIFLNGAACTTPMWRNWQTR